jgi:Flp pilus assembly pilin Flp
MMRRRLHRRRRGLSAREYALLAAGLLALVIAAIFALVRR